MAQLPTILIVEDDVVLAEIACEIVQLAGVEAVFRTTVADALAYLSRNASTTVGVITDINLSSPMGGVELAVFISQEWPDLAICVTSGWTGERPRQLPAGAHFVAKPWTTADIIGFAESAAAARSPQG